MTEHIGSRATWIVPHEDADAYFKNGAEDIVEDPGGNVSRARNIALDLSFRGPQQHPCLLLDDDLIDCKRYFHPNHLESISFEEGVERLTDQLYWAGLLFGATTHVTNPLFLKEGYSIAAVINGGCLIIRPNELRFDESIRLSEDVDYAIQHIVRYGGALRSNDVVMRFKRRAPGGVQLYRDDFERDKSVQQLMKKWPGIITRSKRDPLHPVMRIRKARSVLL